MNPARDRLKHLLIILLEALSVSPEEGPPSRARIQNRVVDAGLDEADVHGLLEWIESNWNLYQDQAPDQEPLPEAPSGAAFRVFGNTELDYLSADGLGYLIQLVHQGQISKVQLEALLQYSSFVAIKPLSSYDLEAVIEQVLFRTQQPGMIGGATEGFESCH